MRRRVPWWLLALLFVVLPVVEIFVLIQIGQVIGAWWTILLLIADGLLGSWLMKREGTRALRALQQALDARRMPARELADGAFELANVPAGEHTVVGWHERVGERRARVRVERGKTAAVDLSLPVEAAR